MPAYRFFLNAQLTLGARYVLPADEARHIKVMRCPPDGDVEIINGRGLLATGRLLSPTEILIVALVEEAPPPPRQLLQAIPKSSRLDFIVEKGTELGMTHLYLFSTQRSEKVTLSPTQRTRIDHIIIAAMKQCGRTTCPTVTLLPPLLSWTVLPTATYFGSLQPNTSWLSPGQTTACLIGPEGGLTEQEEQHVIHLGAIPIRLHTNILRTDTAALVALTLMG